MMNVKFNDLCLPKRSTGLFFQCMKLVIGGLRSGTSDICAEIAIRHTYVTWICGLLLCQILHDCLTKTDELSPAN